MNIMLIDDDIACLDGLMAALEPAGYRCDPFDRPDLAVAAYDDRYDVVISDVRMPLLDGLEVTQAIRRKNPGANVVLVTGHSSQSLSNLIDEKMVSACFEKPINISDLMMYLENIKKLG